MAINFPSNPNNGDTILVGNTTYTFDSTSGAWDASGSLYTVSETAPTNPKEGDMWFDPSVLETYVYYNDGTSSQWVISNNSQGPAGPAGPAGTDGADGTAGADGADGASGIIQSQFTSKTDTFVGTANGTEMAVTDMSVTITPSSASNKIYLTAQISYGTQGTTYKAWFKRSIDGGAYQDIFIGDAAGSRQRTSIPLALASDANQANSFILQFIDEPATTSEVTYQLYVNNDNNIAFHLNRSNNDLDNATGGRYISTIIALELGA